SKNKNGGKRLYDENGKGIYAEFDVRDLIKQKDYEVIGVESNHIFDLGDGYEVELIPSRGHTRGMSGYLDKHNHVLFCGDLTSVLGSRGKGEKDPKETCEQLRDDIQAIVDRIDEINGVFPGHGMLDQTPTVLVYELNTLNQILNDPANYDDHVFIQRPGRVMESYRKNIHLGTAVRYMMESVYKDK
ncbi:MAG: MBL fold metallo-hydrolase, partial [Erysipelotrichaceae bacterium]|nr:MBL fold metallo-hydrolase [Erysipelotrichaceae bacterium]